MFLKMKSILYGTALIVLFLLSSSRASPAAAAQGAVCGETYTVVYGDSLGEVAARCRTTVRALLAANPAVTNPNLIYVGQKLALRRPGQHPDAPTTYVVKPGDTLANIAAQFGFTLSMLRRENPGITNPNLIYPGQILSLPSGPDGKGGSVTNPFNEVTIFLIAPEEGQLGCGDRLVPVTRQIPPTQAPLRAALTELLGLKEQWYGQSGLYNALYSSELQIENIELQNGQATIFLTGQVEMGGVCDTPRFEAQLQQTATQFKTVDSAEILINGRPLEEVTSLR